MHTEVEEQEKWLFALFHFRGCVPGSSTLFSSATSFVRIRQVSTSKWGGATMYQGINVDILR